MIVPLLLLLHRGRSGSSSSGGGIGAGAAADPRQVLHDKLNSATLPLVQPRTDLVRSFQRRAAGHHNKHIFVALIVPSECVLPFDEYPPPPPTTTTRLRVLYHQIPDEDTVVVLPSLEIKTKLAADRVNTALSLITRHGKDYFTVRGGDSLFYAVVPNEYRGQLLHQAAVLRLNYVLFMLARTSGVLYQVRVLWYGF